MSGELLGETSIPSWEFKAGVHRVKPKLVGDMYRWAHLPRFVWVVEAIDKNKLAAGSPDVVLGEAILDSTANHVAEPHDVSALLGLHACGFAVSQSPDHAEVRQIDASQDFAFYPSGCGAAAY